MKPTLIKGIPSLNIQSIEPLHIPMMEMAEGSGNFKLRQKLDDLYIHGVSNYTVEKINFDFDKKVLNFTIYCPKMDFDGNYELDGKILLLPVKGRGKVVFNFTDVRVSANIQLETFKKKDQKNYVRAVRYILDIVPGNAHSYFTNLFNGDKLLGEQTNKFLNDNWKEAYYTYKSLPERAFAEYFKAITNSVLEKFPVDELFPK